MMGRTHEFVGGAAWLGTLAALPALAHAGLGAIVGGWFIACLAALGPDIDHPRATITRLLGPVTRGINKLLLALGVKHRGFTHSLAATGIVGVIFGACVLYWHLVPWVAIAVVAGWLSHSLIDAIGKQKVRFLWPAKGGFCMYLVSAGSGIEDYAIFPLAMLANCFLFWLVIF